MRHLQWWTDLCAWQLDDLPLVIVTVVRADGSTPREVGATMLLRFDIHKKIQQSDTIGGGHLEYQAIDLAKNMLIDSSHPDIILERFNLSARLGQCCGGVMWVVFEKMSPSKLNDEFLLCQQAWENGHHIIRLMAQQKKSSWVVTSSDESKTDGLIQNEQVWEFTQKIQPFQMNVLIFGAGHVGEAIVRCLLPIGVKIKWVDPRDEIFPLDLVDAVECISTDIPEANIDTFPRSGAILILTHDHQLDLKLCFSALKPMDSPFAFVGMIGSKSKRAIFEKRMSMRGYTEQNLKHLVCPIGMNGISSKQPAIIAIAVVAQLLQVFDSN